MGVLEMKEKYVDDFPLYRGVYPHACLQQTTHRRQCGLLRGLDRVHLAQTQQRPHGGANIKSSQLRRAQGVDCERQRPSGTVADDGGFGRNAVQKNRHRVCVQNSRLAVIRWGRHESAPQSSKGDFLHAFVVRIPLDDLHQRSNQRIPLRAQAGKDRPEKRGGGGGAKTAYERTAVISLLILTQRTQVHLYLINRRTVRLVIWPGSTSQGGLRT